VLAVEFEARISHLYREGRMRRMRLAIRGANPRYHDQIGFGRRLVVERHRHLSPHDPARWQDSSQRVIGGADGRGVAAALGLGDDELPSDELDGIALEETEVNESLVLEPFPALEGQRGWRHASTLTGAGEVSNVLPWIHGDRERLANDRGSRRLRWSGEGRSSAEPLPVLDGGLDRRDPPALAHRAARVELAVEAVLAIEADRQPPGRKVSPTLSAGALIVDHAC
jgi:hypothetical protein